MNLKDALYLLADKLAAHPSGAEWEKLAKEEGTK
jgi:hypothetical protein